MRGRTAEPARPAPSKPKAAPKATKPSAPRDKPTPPAKTGAKLGDTGGAASEKMREVGVRYTPTSTPDGGLTMKADI